MSLFNAEEIQKRDAVYFGKS